MICTERSSEMINVFGDRLWYAGAAAHCPGPAMVTAIGAHRRFSLFCQLCGPAGHRG